MNTMQKGQIAYLKVELRAIEKGIIVSKPTIEGCRYDCVLDDGNKLYRTQIKYADGDKNGRNPGVVCVSLTKPNISGSDKSQRVYTDKEIDLLLVYIPKIDKICWIESEIFNGKTCINLRLEPTRNNMSKGILMANDFIWT